VQGRVDLKGQVTEVYSCLLAQLCLWSWSKFALWFAVGVWGYFSLEFDEVRRVVEGSDLVLNNQLRQLVEERRSQLKQIATRSSTPGLRQCTLSPTPHRPNTIAPNQLLQGWCQS